MITALIYVAIVVWVLVAVVLALAIGTAISTADRRELPSTSSKPCCPHEVSTAPETVRGEFRAVVVPFPVERRGSRVDVRS